MTRTALHDFLDGVGSSWGALTSELVAACQRRMEVLLAAPAEEAWLAELHREALPTSELYRDPNHGFVLLAHAERSGLYRPPHDHGASWVLYGIQHGEVEMGSYARLVGEDGEAHLVRRNTTRVSAGQAQLYLPGDIHDTLCLSDSALVFRFTERDLRIEDKRGRLTRYTHQDGVWTTRSRVA
jgi:hypothetical protein